MTLPADIRQAGPFATTGGETVLAYGFKITNAASLIVLRERGGSTSVLALNDDYTVSGVNSESGGNVTLTSAALAGDTYVVFGDTPQQLVAAFSAGGINPAHLTAEHRSLQDQLIELRRDLARTLRSSPFSASDASLELPQDVANKRLGFDADGNLDVFDPGGEGGGSIPDPLPIDDGGTGGTDAASARANLALLSEVETGALIDSKLSDFNDNLGALAHLDAVSADQIDDNSVTLDALAHGTPNYYLGFDANGAPTEIAEIGQAKVQLIASGRTGGSRARIVKLTNGDVLVFGVANFGGASVDTSIPQPLIFNVAARGEIVDIVVGGNAVYVLDDLGRVYSFGGNAAGQLGHGDTTARYVATRIEALVQEGANVVEIAASCDGGGSQDYVLFRTQDGRVYACGANASGQLGLGDTTQRTTPVRVLSLGDGVSAIRVASNATPHSFALKSGVIWAAGENSTGQLGLGTTVDTLAWTQVASITNAADILAGSGADFGSTLLRRADGSLWSCGRNDSGQLGLGDQTDRSAFAQINLAGQTATAIAMNGDGTAMAAIMANGHVRIWGKDVAGETGDGTAGTVRTTPFNPSATWQGTVAQVHLAGYGAHTASFVRTTGGRVYAAGYALRGNIGTGSLSATNATFAELPFTGVAEDVATSGLATYWGATILLDDGRIVVTGPGAEGELGLGYTPAEMPYPVSVPLINRGGPRGATGPAGPQGQAGTPGIFHPVSATTYYVALDGDDSANGLTAGTALRTVRKATELAAPGDILHLGAGLHDDDAALYINKRLSVQGDTGAIYRVVTYLENADLSIHGPVAIERRFTTASPMFIAICSRLSFFEVLDISHASDGVAGSLVSATGSVVFFQAVSGPQIVDWSNVAQPIATINYNSHVWSGDYLDGKVTTFKSGTTGGAIQITSSTSYFSGTQFVGPTDGVASGTAIIGQRGSFVYCTSNAHFQDFANAVSYSSGAFFRASSTVTSTNVTNFQVPATGASLIPDNGLLSIKDTGAGLPSANTLLVTADANGRQAKGVPVTVSDAGAVAGVVSINGLAIDALSNLLINPSFEVNQRNFAGGTLNNLIYGWDRWKAGSTGTNVSVASGVVTLTSGTLRQVIESPGLASQQVTLAVDDLTGGDLTVTIGGVAATITAGAGTRSATVTLGAGATGNITVDIAGASVSFTRPRLCVGSQPQPWRPRLRMIEEDLCRRYYQRNTVAQYADIGTGRVQASTHAVFVWRFPTVMRAGPTGGYDAAGNEYRAYVDGTQYTGGAITSIASTTPTDAVIWYGNFTGLPLLHPASVRQFGTTQGHTFWFDAEL